MKKLYVAGLVAAGTLMSCGDDTLVNQNSESKKTGNISFYIKDSFDGSKLDSVSVVLQGLKVDSNLTDTLGFTQWKGFTIGEYVYEVTKAGYATQRYQVSLNDNGVVDFPRVQDQVIDVELSKLGAAVAGKAYYLEEGQNKPLSGATVLLYVSSAFVPSVYTATTAADGSYSFTNLPEYTAYTIEVQKTIIDGKLYDNNSFSANSVRAGETLNASSLVVGIDAPQMVLTTENSKTLDSAEALALTFSEELDASEIKLNDVYVSNGGDEVLVTWALSKDKKTLSITPFSGKWFSGTFTLQYSLTSVQGDGLTGTLNFSANAATVVPGNADVDTAEVTPDGFGTNDYYFTWKKVTGATGYKIFGKTNATNAAFVEITTTSGTSRYFSLDENDGYVSFIVLPYNDFGPADFTKATLVIPVVQSP